MSLLPLRTRRTRRRERIRPVYAVLSGAVVLGLVASFIALSVTAPRGVPLLGFKTIYADVPDSGNLRIHSEVRVSGVRVGEVVGVTPQAGRARVRLKLDPGQLDAIPADSRISIRSRGLLGSRFVDLRPGTSPKALREKGTLGPSSNPLTLGLAESLETFDGETRGALGNMIGEFGRGTLGRGRGLNDTLRLQPQMDRQLDATFDALGARPGATRAFVPGLNAGAVAVSGARNELARLLAPAARGARAFGDRSPQIRRLLDEAPLTLAAARPALDEGQRLLLSAQHLSIAASRTLPNAPGGLRAATALLRESPGPLQRTTSLLKTAGPSVPAALKITRSLDPLLAPAGRLLSDLTPATRILGRYGCDIVNFGGNWRSVLNQAVAGGGSQGPLTAFRVEVIAAPDSASGFVKNSDTGIAHDGDPYTPPCKNAVDRVYDAAGGVPGSGGGR